MEVLEEQRTGDSLFSDSPSREFPSREVSSRDFSRDGPSKDFRSRARSNTQKLFGLENLSEYGFGSNNGSESSASRRRSTKKRNTALRQQTHDGVDEKLLREPQLAMGPYGKTWQESVVTGPQNAVKKELRDFHIIITSLLARASNLTDGDFDSFLDWYHPFHNFIQVFFVAEEKVLFAAVERDAPLKGRLSLENRQPFRQRMLGILSAIRNCQNMGVDYEFNRTIAQIKKAIDKFSIQLVNYFHAQCVAFPQMLQGMYEPREGLSITRNIVQTFAKSPGANLTVCMLGRWLKDELREYPKAHAEWKYDALPKSLFLRYVLWEKKFDRRILQVAYFTKKKKEYLAQKSSVQSLVNAAVLRDSKFAMGETALTCEMPEEEYWALQRQPQW